LDEAMTLSKMPGPFAVIGIDGLRPVKKGDEARSRSFST
jgi:hypothetical protein